MITTHTDAMLHLETVMVGTKFPENVGMAARACANMGCRTLNLVSPFRWDMKKAEPLATPKGMPVLENITVFPSLEKAVAPCSLIIGTTARTGGWRRHVITPEQAAEESAARLIQGERIALVFGPEDRGLENTDIEQCDRLITIPTAGEASSLNVAQAMLLVLHAFYNALDARSVTTRDSVSGRISHEEQEILYKKIRQTLLAIDFLKPDNPDYFLMPLRRFFGKTDLRRHEMDMLMGICRQILNIAERAERTQRP
ncbi:MAG: RNA methyltransferase [Desulfovibrionaceae bacterium]|nr:RNA methyltransferase [Desulfovibrionaceae bacterium]